MDLICFQRKERFKFIAFSFAKKMVRRIALLVCRNEKYIYIYLLKLTQTHLQALWCALAARPSAPTAPPVTSSTATTTPLRPSSPPCITPRNWTRMVAATGSTAWRISCQDLGWILAGGDCYGNTQLICISCVRLKCIHVEWVDFSLVDWQISCILSAIQRHLVHVITTQVTMQFVVIYTLMQFEYCKSLQNYSVSCINELSICQSYLSLR